MVHAFAFLAAGVSSYYTRKSSGATMANGQPMNDRAHICATRHMVPYGTHLLIVNSENGDQSWCIMSDYGPAEWTARIIDVSLVVRRELGFVYTAHVRVYRDLGPAPEPHRLPPPITLPIPPSWEHASWIRANSTRLPWELPDSPSAADRSLAAHSGPPFASGSARSS